MVRFSFDGALFSKKIGPIIKNQAVNLHIIEAKMRQRRNFFLVVCLLMFYGKIFSQEIFRSTPVIPLHTPKKQVFSPLFGYQLPSPAIKRVYTPVLLHPVIWLKPLAGDFFVNGLGIICRKEWQLEKSSGIPFRFRLGSLEYVNKLEGK